MRPADKAQSEPDLKDASRGVRLQKAMAEAGVGSRRRCEELIEQGRVRVNGARIADLPVWVDPEQDEIEVAGRILPRATRHIYVMLNKPRNVVSTLSDPAGRKTLTDLVNHPAAERLYPVGRLDYDTTGLILMTNDGELANQLTHPRYGVHKSYRAVIKGLLADEDIASLERGIFLAERREGRTVGARRAAHVGLKVVRRDRDRTILELTLAEGRNRQVRRMLANVGHPVRKLQRVGMGPIKLKGLQLGQWRELSSGELAALRNAVRKGASGGAKQGGAR